MSFNSPDIETFKANLDNNIVAIQKLKKDSHATIKIQSLLNITIYVLATRFLEGAVKHIIYNCCIMRGDSEQQLLYIDSELKKFNNPEFTNIKSLFDTILNFDIMKGSKIKYQDSDISFLNEIVKNRHRNVHAPYDSSEWYSKNLKDITTDFVKEYKGIISILEYLDSISYDSITNQFKD